MKHGVGGTNKNIYASILLFMTLIAVLIIITLSAVLYQNFENIELKNIYSYELNYLTQTGHAASLMTSNAKTLAAQIYSDFYVSKLMNYRSLDISDLNAALAQLNNYRYSSTFIDSIYVYNSRSSLFYISSESIRMQIESKEGFEDKEVISILDKYKSFNSFSPIPRIIPLTHPVNGVSNCYTFLYYDTLTTENSYNNFVIINISEAWLHNVIGGLMVNTKGNTFIIDKNGKLVSSSWKEPMLSDLSNKKYIEASLNKPDKPGYIIENIDGEKSLITYTAFDSLGWRYVHITPYISITGKIDHMSKNTLLICFSIMILSFCFSYAISKKLYKPIDRIITKLKTFETQKINNIREQKHEFLRNLLLDCKRYKHEELKDKFDYCEVNFDIDDKLFLILFKIDKYHTFCSQNNYTERSSIKLDIMGTCSKLLTEYGFSEAVDMGDNSIIAILRKSTRESTSNEPNTSISSIYAQLKEIQSYIMENSSISLSITASNIYDIFDNFSMQYNQLLECSLYRIFYGHRCIINASEKVKDNIMGKYYVYPQQKEKQLIDSLMSGKTDEVKSIYLEIVNETAKYHYTVINMVISHLIFNLKTVIEVIQKNNGITIPLVNLLVIPMKDIETIDEINSHFISTFETISTALKDKKSTKYTELIDRVLDIIHSEYSSPSLSLGSIADHLNISAIYVGRLFKKYTLKTIFDYVIEIRMSKAKEYLEKTSYSISEIAEKTGFTNNSYFYKVFKKVNGVTPNEFRKKYVIPKNNAELPLHRNFR